MPPNRRSMPMPPAKTSDGGATETPGECPACKSFNVAIMVDPKTCKLITFMGHTGFRCGDCGKDFTADYVQSYAAMALRKPSAIIDEDLNCPKCKGPIRGQRAGKACAGCGEILPEHLSLSRCWERKKVDLSIGWLVGVVIAGVGGYAAYLNASTSRGPGIVLVLVAIYQFFKGARGIATGEAKLSDKWLAKTYSGRKATAVSILHLLIGAAILAVGILLIYWQSPITKKH